MRRVLLVCLSILVPFAGGCASSGARLLETWRAPGTMSFVFERSAVLVLNGGPERRATLEAEIVSAGNPSRLVAASNVLRPEELRSLPSVRQKLMEQGFDGILVMRLVRATEINPGESSQGESFTTYAGSVAPDDPPFGEGKLRIETSVYRLADEGLVWRAMVESDTSSNDPRIVVREAVSVMKDHLRGTGLVHD